MQIINLRTVTESIVWNPLQAIYDQFKENYWRKNFTSYAVTGEMPLAKTGARGKWYRKF